MSGRAIRIISRILFFLCGGTSLFTGVPYVLLQGSDMPVHHAWFLFPVALGVVGVLSLTVAVLPRSWIAKACKRERDDAQLFSAPLKLLGVFAAISYLLALLAYFAPHSWDLNPTLMLSLCPMYFLKLTIDPSLVSVFFMLAPMNAAAYGALGVTLGCAWLAFGRRTSG
ncbi:MAG: hypothetical protein WBQ08_03275 [Candidatus Sulfotelmatobacter sp.]